MFQVTLQQQSALGAGTREPGTVLGTMECADGVELTELLTALRNPKLISIGGVRTETSAERKAAAEAAAEVEEPKPAAEAPKRRTSKKTAKKPAAEVEEPKPAESTETDGE